MRVAIAVKRHRISSLFDVSRQLLLLDLVDGRVARRTRSVLQETECHARAASLVRLGVHTLMCGAISRDLAALIEATGIHLHSYVVGDVEEVIAAWLSGRLDSPEFQMPGHGDGRHRPDDTPPW